MRTHFAHARLIGRADALLLGQGRDPADPHGSMAGAPDLGIRRLLRRPCMRLRVLSLPTAPRDLDSGEVGVVLNGAEAHYDNFVVTGDEIPDMSTLVESSGKRTTSWASLKSHP